MLLLGIDLGTSSVKVSVVDAGSQQLLASATFPETEVPIMAPHPGWAEQDPEQWWIDVQQAILKCHAKNLYDPRDIAAIGIAYQMHGLVITDRYQQSLRPAIIWCDSRAVEIGNKAFHEIGEDHCLSRLLNSPGNFTASKLAWVKENEPSLYEKTEKIMLPGDYIALKMTGEITSTPAALSEGIFWDFRENQLSSKITSYFGFGDQLFPAVQPVFSIHGYIQDAVAARLKLKQGIPVSYKAGDQPNNALALNVVHPGEVAATAGTSGVIYGISDELHYDLQSRINSFAHVNHEADKKRIGILLCINGAGIFNRWIKNIAGAQMSYTALNEAAASVSPGASGLIAIPFGNGAERMLNNRIVGAQFHQLDLNVHGTPHLARAVQEGIAFAFRYGLDIMRENGINPVVVRAGLSNLFLSPVFSSSFANVNQVSIEFYEGDGSYGAAIGAGLGAGIYKNINEASQHRKPVATIEAAQEKLYEDLYQQWKERLQVQLESIPSNAMSWSFS
ncbi:MAG TPA: FGGY family carbohydrate kinase [Chitinophagaceae bacterium]|nr:FGGY family carbohydrate kinase [Chitinophagaceae bacterium]